jgi:hypothetical protein
MRLRLLGGTLLVLLLTLLMAVPALGGEDEEEFDEHGVGPLPSIEEVGTGTEVAEQFRPEPPGRQPFTDALLWPLMGAAVLLALIVLVLYLRWMPRFAEERKSSERR